MAEFLKLILKNPFNYKNILAVTFTNKATTEMKSRILRQLNQLAQNEDSDYIQFLKNEIVLSEQSIRKRARQVLKNILHDYNRFSVSTIDSFTQRIIKSFNRELGISPQFTLELDDDILLEEATDRLLARLDTDKQLRKWLTGFSEEKITENKSQRIEDDIKSLGKELFKERFQLFFPEHEKTVYTRQNIEDFRIELEKIIQWFENYLTSSAQKAISAIEGNGFSIDDFLHKKSGVAGYFKKLSEKRIDPPGIRTLQAAEDEQKWFLQKHHQKEKLNELVVKILQPTLKKIIVFYNDNAHQYYSAIAVKKQLRMLGILTDLKEEIRSLLHEKGVLQLSDSNLLLSQIIGESDAPFIYEKIGNRYQHFMLDEFQDTSALQWNNFKPLVSNSLSEGNSNLLVGDVKQSIYRWRNSDWNILAEQINSDFPNFYPETRTLDKNWRSRQNIIDFNNAAIGALKEVTEKYLLDEIENEFSKNKFNRIYTGFQQQPGKPESIPSGLARINFLDEDDFENQSAKLLIEQVKQLQDNGLKASETVILLRVKKEGSKIIEVFQEAAQKPENANYNLSVLSGESLFLQASKGTNFVMLLIELLIEPDNKITKTALLNLWLKWLKPRLEKNWDEIEYEFKPDFSWPIDEDPETLFVNELEEKFNQVKNKVLLASLDELIMEICSLFGLFQLESELPYLQTLIDQAAELKTSISNDLSNLLHWWNEGGNESSVNVNEEVDAIRLLTVHKAKGLEFEAVLIPNFNWDISWKGIYAPVLWCKPGSKPFNRFPLLPVKAGSSLAETIFRSDYYEEKVNSIIDTMNLVYVAFTRAKSVLMVHAKKMEEKKKKNGPGKSVNGLLKYALDQLSNSAFTDCRDDEKTVFSYGTMPRFNNPEKKANSFWIRTYNFNTFSSRIRLRLNSEDFLTAGRQQKSVKNMGKLVHEILSEIVLADELEAACMKALKEGKIDESEADFIEKKLKENLSKPEIKSWFDGSYIVLPERELICKDQLLRPDRIMVSHSKAVVVDYKWGAKITGKYNSQVRRYAETLLETGFKKVEGYLWYLNEDEVEKVCAY